MTRVRAKLGIEEKAVAAQEASLADAKLPPPRDSMGGKSTEEVFTYLLTYLHLLALTYLPTYLLTLTYLLNR